MLVFSSIIAVNFYFIAFVHEATFRPLQFCAERERLKQVVVLPVPPCGRPWPPAAVSKRAGSLRLRNAGVHGYLPVTFV